MMMRKRISEFFFPFRSNQISKIFNKNFHGRYLYGEEKTLKNIQIKANYVVKETDKEIILSFHIFFDMIMELMKRSENKVIHG